MRTLTPSRRTCCTGNAPSWRAVRALLLASVTLGLVICAAACSRHRHAAGVTAKKEIVAAKSDPALMVRPVILSDAVQVSIQKVPIDLAAAKNEWASFTLQINELPPSVPLGLRLRPLRRVSGASASASVPMVNCEVYQILPMPVDVNRAAYIRHTGQHAGGAGVGDGRLPRALLPLKAGQNGLIPLTALRDPAHPYQPASGAWNGTGPIHLWVDVQIPADAPAGQFQTACEIVPLPVPAPEAKKAKSARSRKAPKKRAGKSSVELAAVASVAVNLHVYDFALPKERHLHLIASVPWESLVRHYEADFQAVTAWKINRTDPRYAGTVKALDDLVRLAQQHRLTVVYPSLQPNVKWPPYVNNAPPTIDWDDFDSLVTPWFKGNFFPDGMGTAYWPLPEPDYLSQYDPRSQLAYWQRAAAHFDQKDWIDKTSVQLQASHPGRLGPGDAIDLSNKAAELLAAHPRMRVTLPLEDDQVQLAPNPVQPGAPALPVGAGGGPWRIDPTDTHRLLTAAAGLVFAPPLRDWPEGVKVPEYWLRSDLPGLCPYFGAGGDERDVRLWAWLAFLRQIRATDDRDAWHTRRAYVQFASALPIAPDAKTPASPHELIWFYPGSWFGVDEPLPTLQLKWLRRAQQDYEYLWLAADREERVHALWLARLITKPVEIQANQVPDPAYTLMSGTTDEAAWPKALNLLAKAILLHPQADTSAYASGYGPGSPPPVNIAKRDELDIETLQWVAPQERPMLLARQALWTWEIAPNQPGGNWLYLRLGLDIYNASDGPPAKNLLSWRSRGKGWRFQANPNEVDPLRTYQVRREFLDAQFDLQKMNPESRTPIEVEFTHGHTGAKHTLTVTVPLAATERMNRRFAFDGKIDDWTELDLIQDGPLVRMLDRPMLQRQSTEPANTNSRIYTGWTANDFAIGFGVEGVSGGQSQGKNFVENYQAGRAWGEDLCEVLVQPVYLNNSVGPLLHVVLKPNGSSWVQRKLNPKQNADPWEPFESTGIRYVANLAAGTVGKKGEAAANGKWTGELAVPWKILNDPNLGMPTLLRFNFSQHRTATGESASWAGPVDFGRDDAFMGCLQVRDPDIPGMAGAAAHFGPDQPR